MLSSLRVTGGTVKQGGGSIMLRGFLFLFFAGTTQAPMGPGHKKQIYNFFFLIQYYICIF